MTDKLNQQKTGTTGISVRHVRWLLFSIRGRLNSKGFYLCQAIIVLLAFPLRQLIATVENQSGNHLALAGWGAFVLFGLNVWIFLSSLTKRWKDIEQHSGWDYFALIAAICAITVSSSLPEGLVAILIILAFGIPPSNPNDNMYGFPPYEGWLPPM